jgi:hypothetical protein
MEWTTKTMMGQMTTPLLGTMLLLACAPPGVDAGAVAPEQAKAGDSGAPPVKAEYLATDGDLSFGAIAPTPGFIYGITANGDLHCYRHNGYLTGAGLDAGAWQYGNTVGTGWKAGLKEVFSGSGAIYAIRDDGSLRWYRHNGFNDCSPSWDGGREVGVGWQAFQHVFAMSGSAPGTGGVIYGIKPDGTLLWYRHLCYESGQGLETPGCWAGGKAVGVGWQSFRQVFSGGDGVIYGIKQDGTLQWYRHNGFTTGAGLDTPGAWEGPVDVGVGWQGFTHVFAGGSKGVIYGIKADGALQWYRHHGYTSGSGLETPGAWEGPKQVGVGWNAFVETTPVSRFLGVSGSRVGRVFLLGETPATFLF